MRAVEFEDGQRPTQIRLARERPGGAAVAHPANESLRPRTSHSKHDSSTLALPAWRLVLLGWLKLPCQHRWQHEKCRDDHHCADDCRYGKSHRSDDQGRRVGEEETNLSLARALPLLAQRVLVTVTSYPDSGSAEQVAAVTDGKSAEHSHDARCVSSDEHPDPECSETETAGSQECAEDREQDDHS